MTDPSAGTGAQMPQIQPRNNDNTQATADGQSPFQLAQIREAAKATAETKKTWQGEGELINIHKMVLRSNPKTFHVAEGLAVEQRGPLSKVTGEHSDLLTIPEKKQLTQTRHLGSAALDMVETKRLTETAPRFADRRDRVENMPPEHRDQFASTLKTLTPESGDPTRSIKEQIAERNSGGSARPGDGPATSDLGVTRRDTSDFAQLDGTDGDDTLVGGLGAQLRGFGGDDTLRGGTASDIDGGAGDDRLEGGAQSQLTGGPGDDDLDAGANSTLDGGPGVDRAASGRGSHVTGGAGGDNLASTDGVMHGGPGHDMLQGLGAEGHGGPGNDFADGRGADTFTTGPGRDYVRGTDDLLAATGQGRDSVRIDTRGRVMSGTGDDHIRTQDGARIRAGQGDDTIITEAGSRVVVGPGSGRDTLMNQGAQQAAYLDLLPNADKMRGTLADSEIHITGGVPLESVNVWQSGNDAVVAYGSQADQVTVKNVGITGMPDLVFDDGTRISGRAINPAVQRST